MAPIPSRVSPKHEEDIYSGPHDLFVEGFWVSYHPALAVQNRHIKTRVPEWFQFEQCSPWVRKRLLDAGYIEEKPTTVVADGPIREGSLLTLVDSECVDCHAPLVTPELDTEVAETLNEVAELPSYGPSSFKTLHADPVEVPSLPTPEDNQKPKKKRKKPQKKKNKPVMANNDEAVDPPANLPPSLSATATVADKTEALDPLTHPLSSSLSFPPPPSATQGSMEPLPAIKAEETRPSKKAPGAPEAQTNGPAEATASTAPEIGPEHTLEDVKTSLGAVVPAMGHTGEVVVPETGHENSDSTNKTDVMRANSTTAVESPSLTASVPELQDRQGPCIVDTEKWRRRCIEKMRAELATRDAVPAVLQQLDFGEMSLSPIIIMPKSFSEPATPNIVTPAPLDPRETETSTMIGERAGQPSTTAHFEGGASPIYPVGSSNANQPLTYCRVLQNCSVHPDGIYHCPEIPESVGAQYFKMPVDENRGGAQPRRLLRFVQDIEHEIHTSCGVKRPEEAADEQLAASMRSIFETNRRLPASSSSNLTLHPPSHLSSTSSHPNTTMRVIHQEVILPVPRPEGEDPNTPSLYFTPKQLMGSSPSGSNSSRRPLLSRRASQISKTGLSAAGSNENTSKSNGSTKSIAMAEHLQALFKTAEFADLKIALCPSAHPNSTPMMFSVHKAIVCASPYLRDVLQTKALQGEPDDIIHAFSGPGFTSAWAFRNALETLYGGELVYIEDIRQHTLYGLGYSDDGSHGTYPFNLERAQTDFALCYAVTGAFLGDSDVTERGICLAIQLLSWETVEVVLNFGMTVENFMITCPDLVYHSPSSGNSPSPDAGPRQIDRRMEHIHEFKYMWAQMALDAAVQFIASNMKPDFELYHRGQAAFTPTRIPAALQTLPGSRCTDFRLENIQFGDMPSFASLRPTRADILVPSGLLLTLPYEMLMSIIDALRAQEAPDVLTVALMRRIVKQRESRRLHALRVFLSHRYDRGPEIPQNELAELGYQELVKIKKNKRGERRPVLLRATVKRQWVGFEVPNEHLLVPRRPEGANQESSS